ncbi:hypothetical protein AJ88_48045 [Mesorhizobium amorphae CCBAU 01583]|nr:hypothetical protein AJ88_48045 [Mesorhizobium amorphae CCBAU 01583]
MSPLLGDQVETLAVGAFALVAAAHVLVGTLDHVGARGAVAISAASRLALSWFASWRTSALAMRRW